VSPSTPLVIHIQDVHGNEQAQRRIGESIESLVSHGLVSAVGLEGASGSISIQRFRDYQNREAVRRAADYLLGEQKISGPIYAALTGNGPWPLTMGIEDPVLYGANVAAYRAAAPAQEKTRARLARERAQIEMNKKSLYSPPLLACLRPVRPGLRRSAVVVGRLRGHPSGHGGVSHPRAISRNGGP
jgi:hypothetical protein